MTKKEKELKKEELTPIVSTPVVPTPEIPQPTKPVVTQEQLEAILKSNEEMQAKIARLEYAADKAQMAKWNDQHREQGLKEVKVIKYHDKYVVGWTKMVENKCEKINGVWEESLRTKLIYEDDSQEEVDYEVWQRNFQFVKGLVTSEMKDSKGNTVFQVELPDRVLTINCLFIN